MNENKRLSQQAGSSWTEASFLHELVADVAAADDQTIAAPTPGQHDAVAVGVASATPYYGNNDDAAIAGPNHSTFPFATQQYPQHPLCISTTDDDAAALLAAPHAFHALTTALLSPVADLPSDEDDKAYGTVAPIIDAAAVVAASTAQNEQRHVQQPDEQQQQQHAIASGMMGWAEAHIYQDVAQNHHNAMAHHFNSNDNNAAAAAAAFPYPVHLSNIPPLHDNDMGALILPTIVEQYDSNSNSTLLEPVSAPHHQHHHQNYARTIMQGLQPVMIMNATDDLTQQEIDDILYNLDHNNHHQQQLQQQQQMHLQNEHGHQAALPTTTTLTTDGLAVAPETTTASSASQQQQDVGEVKWMISTNGLMEYLKMADPNGE